MAPEGFDDDVNQYDDDKDSGDDPDDHDQEEDLDQCHRHDTGGIQVEIFRKSAASACSTFGKTTHLKILYYKAHCAALWQNYTLENTVL